jgi:predicted RNA-binding Zn ribbon-like protein
MPVHCKVVEGLTLPARLGGHPALDFCNTWSGWDGVDTWDYLESYEHLAVWAGFVELLDAEHVASLRREARRHPQTARDFVDEARLLRGRLYDALCNGGAANSFDHVARDVHAGAANLRLQATGEAIRLGIGPETGLAAPLAAVAWSAGQLLISTQRSLIRACPGQGCGWLFLDLRGRRRWCTMATCGNRAKVKRFATRHRASR